MDEDRARRRTPSARPSTSRPSWSAARAAGLILTSSTSRCVSTTCRRGLRPVDDFLAHLNTLPGFEQLKMLANGTLEAVAVHRRNVHDVCQPDTAGGRANHLMRETIHPDCTVKIYRAPALTQSQAAKP
jgi:hypothetical protein